MLTVIIFSDQVKEMSVEFFQEFLLEMQSNLHLKRRF